MTFRKPQVITRSSAGAYGAGGLWVPGSTENVTVMASIQPLSGTGGEAGFSLPEGKRVQDTVRVYSDSELRDAQEKKGIEADRMVWRGDEYECISVEEWQSGVISHFKAMFTKVS